MEKLLERSRKKLSDLERTIAKAKDAIDSLTHTHSAFLQRHFALETYALEKRLTPLLKKLMGESFKNLEPVLQNAVYDLMLVLHQKGTSSAYFKSVINQLERTLRTPTKDFPKQPKPRPALKKDRLKILYVTGMFPATRHGGGQRLFDILGQLTQRHSVDLYSTYSEASDRESLMELAPLLDNVRLTPNLVASDMLLWLKQLGRKAKHYDVIQFEYLNSVPLMMALEPFAKKTGFTLMESVTLHHKMSIEKQLSDSQAPNLGWPLHGLLEAAHLEMTGLQNSNFSIAVSEEDAKFTEDTFGHRPFVVPTGISQTFLSRFEKIKKPTRPTYSVGFIGYFDHPPNFDGVVWYVNNVHEIIRKKIPGYSVVIVGGGNRVAELQEICRNFEGIHVTGYVDDFAEVLKDVKICMAPLISGAGIRGKLHQFAALHKAFVTTSLGAHGVSYAHQESALVADHPKDFAKAIEVLLKDEQLRKKIADNALDIVSNEYSWKSVIKRVETIYAT